MTIVCPVYNEETTVPLFYERFTAAIGALEGKVRIELLFVNNRSADGTFDAIRSIQQRDPRVNLITLSRNYGYQASITAGMRYARGDAVVNIDVDCEDPPELIPELVDKWLGGADVAYGIRDKREEFFLMHLGRKLFYRVTRLVADHEIVLDMAEFFLVDKRVRDAVLSTKSTFPFVRGQVGYVGFRREGIRYTRQRRVSGDTHYNLVSAARFGIGGILSSSTLPLRLLADIGVVALVLDPVLAAAFVWLGQSLGMSLGARLAVAVVFVHLGWMMFAFGMVGIYLARVYKDSIALPLYVVDEKASFAQPPP